MKYLRDRQVSYQATSSLLQALALTMLLLSANNADVAFASTPDADAHSKLTDGVHATGGDSAWLIFWADSAQLPRTNYTLIADAASQRTLRGNSGQSDTGYGRPELV